MTQEFVPYELAVKLKELGFDEPCFGYYNGNYEFTFFVDVRSCNTNSEFKFYPTAPTYSQAFRWFRDVHKLWGYQIPWSGNMYCMQIWRLIEDSETVKTIQDRVIMNTWEEAELACLEKLIEIVETKSE
jgi:hypothetical protein